VRELWRWLRPDGQLRLYWWLVHLPAGPSEPTLAASEVAEARWVTHAEFRRLEPILESNLAFLDSWTPPNPGSDTPSARLR
jgi:hypothetical protein